MSSPQLSERLRSSGVCKTVCQTLHTDKIQREVITTVVQVSNKNKRTDSGTPNALRHGNVALKKPPAVKAVKRKKKISSTYGLFTQDVGSSLIASGAIMSLHALDQIMGKISRDLCTGNTQAPQQAPLHIRFPKLPNRKRHEGDMHTALRAERRRERKRQSNFVRDNQEFMFPKTYTVSNKRPSPPRETYLVYPRKQRRRELPPGTVLITGTSSSKHQRETRCFPDLTPPEPQSPKVGPRSPDSWWNKYESTLMTPPESRNSMVVGSMHTVATSLLEENLVLPASPIDHRRASMSYMETYWERRRRSLRAVPSRQVTFGASLYSLEVRLEKLDRLYCKEKNPEIIKLFDVGKEMIGWADPRLPDIELCHCPESYDKDSAINTNIKSVLVPVVRKEHLVKLECPKRDEAHKANHDSRKLLPFKRPRQEFNKLVKKLQIKSRTGRPRTINKTRRFIYHHEPIIRDNLDLVIKFLVQQVKVKCLSTQVDALCTLGELLQTKIRLRDIHLRKICLRLVERAVSQHAEVKAESSGALAMLTSVVEPCIMVELLVNTGRQYIRRRPKAMCELSRIMERIIIQIRPSILFKQPRLTYLTLRTLVTFLEDGPADTRTRAEQVLSYFMGNPDFFELLRRHLAGNFRDTLYRACKSIHLAIKEGNPMSLYYDKDLEQHKEGHHKSKATSDEAFSDCDKECRRYRVHQDSSSTGTSGSSVGVEKSLSKSLSVWEA